MTLSHTHGNEPAGSRGLYGGSPFSAARATRKISAALRAIHRAIMAGKLRRLRRELMLRRQTHAPAEHDAAKFPRRPLLSEKWEFQDMSRFKIVSIRKVVAVAANALAWVARAAIGPTKAYHPEQHYMRGPGPKWREKHLLGSGR